MPKYVITDEKRLRQILINLLSNAVKYTNEGSIEFTVRYRNQVAEFCIKDTGIGIPASEYERIFKPFERVRLPGVPQVTGTGLGLTITRLLIDIMGGELRLEPNKKSTINKQYISGTVFTVSLMLSSADHHTPESAPAKVITGFEGGSKKLLILDDDPFHRGLVFETLTPLGFTVFEAPDIETAQQKIDLPTIDLFILDVNLPDSSGWSFATSLREEGIKAPILMVSADADEGQHLPNEPHNGYIIKPIKISDLLDKLQALLGLTWVHQSANMPPINHSFQNTNNARAPIPLTAPLANTFDDMLAILKIAYDHADSGNLNGLQQHLKTLSSTSLLSDLQPFLDTFDLPKITAYLEQKIHECQAKQ